MAVYFPERANPSAGVARVMVLDSTDSATNSTTPFFVDSNGCVADETCALPNAGNKVRGASQRQAAKFLTAWSAQATFMCVWVSWEVGIPSNTHCVQSVIDGGWHLVGVTTQPGGGKGFQVYLDGALAAQVHGGVLYKGAPPPPPPPFALTSAARPPACKDSRSLLAPVLTPSTTPALPYPPDAAGYGKAATGGGPLNLTGGAITLCARSDLDPSVRCARDALCCCLKELAYGLSGRVKATAGPITYVST